MRRREFITLLGGAAAWPLAARAQQSTMALVGLLSGALVYDYQFRALRQGLKEAGYIEGRNIAIKYVSADGRFERLPALAAELVADPSAVIVAIAPPAALAAKAATATIPIVFTAGADPIDLGLVSSLNRPGGNVTGVHFLIAALAAKQLELLRELVPSSTAIGLLVNPANPVSQSQTRDVQAAAVALGLKLPVLNASSEGDIEAAFASFVQQRVDAVLVGSDPFFLSRRDQLIRLAARHAISAMYSVREFAVAGGIDDRLRRSRRHEHASHGFRLLPSNADVFESRHIGQRRRTLLGGDCKRAQLEAPRVHHTAAGELPSASTPAEPCAPGWQQYWLRSLAAYKGWKMAGNSE